MPTSVPAGLAAWMQPFAASFTPAVWCHVLVLVAGVVLAPGRRTVTAALRVMGLDVMGLDVMGLDQEAGFGVYHRGLRTGGLSSRAPAHPLLLVLVSAFVPQRLGAMGLGEPTEGRRGAKITARGI